MSEPRPSSDSSADAGFAAERAAARGMFRRALSVDPRERLAPSPAGGAWIGDRARTSPRSDYLRLKGDLQERLLEVLGERDLRAATDEEITVAVEDFVRGVLATEELALNQTERARLSEELVQEALGLGPLAPLLADPAVTDVLVNGAEQVFVERFGRLERTDVRFRDDEHVERIIERLAIRVGRRIDRSWPMVDMRLADGSRVNATIPPASIDGPTLSIRRFGRQRLTQRHLMRNGMLSPEMAEFLSLCVRERQNVLVSGGTGAGKSTLLGALAEAIPRDDRIITIEDTAELVLDQDHVVRLETRPANIEGEGRITARDLLVNALRMRPTRIIVGEVRGGEALDMLQAMNTGHEGSLSTIHANSVRDALSRLETMVLFAGTELPSRAIREQIVSAVQIVVHVSRYPDGVRRIASVAEITGMEGTTPLLQELFHFRTESARDERVTGRFEPTGIVPRLVDRLRERGRTPPRIELFQGALPEDEP